MRFGFRPQGPSAAGLKIRGMRFYSEMNTAAIILAAGVSSRMPGRNKLLLSWSGKTIIEQTIDNLRQSAVQELIVILGFEAEKIQAAIRERQIRCVLNPDY